MERLSPAPNLPYRQRTNRQFSHVFGRFFLFFWDADRLPEIGNKQRPKCLLTALIKDRIPRAWRPEALYDGNICRIVMQQFFQMKWLERYAIERARIRSAYSVVGNNSWKKVASTSLSAAGLLYRLWLMAKGLWTLLKYNRPKLTVVNKPKQLLCFVCPVPFQLINLETGRLDFVG